MNLSKNVKQTPVLGYYAAGTTKRTSAIVDMAGYEGVRFTVLLGTLIQNGTLDAYCEENSTNSTTGMARIPASTTAVTVTAGMAALTVSSIIIDVYQPGKQYIQCNITPATQNAVILGIIADQYNGKVKPSVQDASVIATNFFQSPSES